MTIDIEQLRKDMEAVKLPCDEPRQIVCTGEEWSDKWNAGFGTWEADEFGISSDEPVGSGERLFVNRRVLDSLLAEYLALREAADALAEALTDVVTACSDRAERLDDYSPECECCAATARNCESDVEQISEEALAAYRKATG